MATIVPSFPSDCWETPGLELCFGAFFIRVTDPDYKGVDYAGVDYKGVDYQG